MALAVSEVLDSRRYLEDLFRTNKAHFDTPQGRGTLQNLEATFPHKWLYLPELLQNAIDAKATEIGVYPNGNDLVFEHNGREFSPKDVLGLCTQGISTKSVGTIGFMGVGFKTVFRNFETVCVSSGSWRFRLSVPQMVGDKGEPIRDWLGAVLPLWDDSIQPPPDGIRCRFVLANRLADSAPLDDDLAKLLDSDRNLLAMLARRGIRRLRWGTESWSLEVSSHLQSKEIKRIMVTGRGQNSATPAVRHWVIFATSYRPTPAAVTRFLTHRPVRSTALREREKAYEQAEASRVVEVFCPTDEHGVPQLPCTGRLYAVLPTGVQVPLRLHVQADWLLTITRQELMDMEQNPWHEDILAAIPRLVAEFCCWTVSRFGRKHGYQLGLDVIPAFDEAETSLERWFLHDGFKKSLRLELMTRAIIPAVDRSGRITLVRPRKACFVPTAFDCLWETKWHPHLLFGHLSTSRRLVGSRGYNALLDLGCVYGCTPDVLGSSWASSEFGTWVGSFGEVNRFKAQARLLSALETLSSDRTWSRIDFPCIPTGSGGWASVAGVRRLSQQWGTVREEPEVADFLLTFVERDIELVDWVFWERVRRADPPTNTSDPDSDAAHLYRARRYLERSAEYPVDKLVSAWWESLAPGLDSQQIGRVVRFTAWVRLRKSLRSWVTHVLVDDATGCRVAEIGTAVLAEPFARPHRKAFHRDNPPIADYYLTMDPYHGSSLDWKSFFETGDPAPKGGFHLNPIGTDYADSDWKAKQELRKRLHGDVPECRVGYTKPVIREGFPVANGHFLIVDYSMPQAWCDAVQDCDSATARAGVQWMTENAGAFRSCSAPKLYFFPKHNSFCVSQPIQGTPAQWLTQLQTNCWVPSGDRVLPPADVLVESDPARPNTPVADIPSDLAQALTVAGLRFGGHIPDAPALMRLEVEGPAARLDVLEQLLIEALEEANEEDAARDCLKRLLIEEELLPAGPGHSASRVPHGRVIRHVNNGTRKDLGWTVAVDSFPDDSPQRRILELVDAFMGFPVETTGGQALDYLMWVWRQRHPETEKVMTSLPDAYRYLVGDMETDSDLARRFEQQRKDVRVFVPSRDRWMGMVGQEAAYFDDLSRSHWPGKETLLLLDPRQLGATPERQLRIAKALGFPLLSSRFESRFDVPAASNTEIPEHWRKGIEVLRSLALSVRPQDGRDETPVPQLAFSMASEISMSITDRNDGKVIDVGKANAALVDGHVYLIGHPDDFAAGLSRILVQLWGLVRQGELCSQIGVLLTKLDSPGKFSAGLNELRRAYGMPEVIEPKSTEPQRFLRVAATGKGRKLGTETRNGFSQTSSRLRTRTDVSETNPHSKMTDCRPADTGDRHATASGKSRSHSFTESSLEARQQSLLNALEKVLASAMEPESDTSSPYDDPSLTDKAYRAAAVEYEIQHGRFPREMSFTNPGYDITSYDSADPEKRKVVRFIEVKGKSALWEGNEIVTLTRRQVREAVRLSRHHSFDYWVYVVSRLPDGAFEVMPLPNPTRLCRYTLKASPWRRFAQKKGVVTVHPVEESSS